MATARSGKVQLPTARLKGGWLQRENSSVGKKANRKLPKTFINSPLYDALLGRGGSSALLKWVKGNSSRIENCGAQKSI